MRKLFCLLSCLALIAVACNTSESVINVTGIRLEEQLLTIERGETKTLKVIIEPSNANDYSLEWESSDDKVITVDEAGNVVGIGPGNATVTAKTGDLFDQCEISVIVRAKSIKLDKPTLQLTAGQRVKLQIEIVPSDATDPIEWSSDNVDVAPVNNGEVSAMSGGTALISVVAGNCKAVCSVNVKPIPAPGAVDLGLSVKWADCNIGASMPHEYGDYFAWGETEPYYQEGHAQDLKCEHWKDGMNGYYQSVYRWEVDYKKYIKYCLESDPERWAGEGKPDNKRFLDPEDDVATRLGKGWRMPTDAEWREIENKCKWTWTTRYGVKGYLVENTILGTGVFFPAAGSRYQKDLRNFNEKGSYWSSELSGGSDEAWCFLFYKSDISYGHSTNDRDREYGFSIRPVFAE